jgi:hypothetical protein
MPSQSNVLSPLSCEVQLPELAADSSSGNQMLSVKNKKGWKTGIERSIEQIQIRQNCQARNFARLR